MLQAITMASLNNYFSGAVAEKMGKSPDLLRECCRQMYKEGNVGEFYVEGKYRFNSAQECNCLKDYSCSVTHCNTIRQRNNHVRGHFTCLTFIKSNKYYENLKLIISLRCSS